MWIKHKRRVTLNTQNPDGVIVSMLMTVVPLDPWDRWSSSSQHAYSGSRQVSATPPHLSLPRDVHWMSHLRLFCCSRSSLCCSCLHLFSSLFPPPRADVFSLDCSSGCERVFCVCPRGASIARLYGDSALYRMK